MFAYFLWGSGLGLEDHWWRWQLTRHAPHFSSCLGHCQRWIGLLELDLVPTVDDLAG
jgi:hypothetical protein